MLTSPTTQPPPAKPPSYRIFDVQLKRRIAVSPSLVRLVFTGPQLQAMRTVAPDQRIKLLFPSADGVPAQLPHERNWHQTLRALPAEHRPPMRTYTIRALRCDALEVDVEFVLHGDTGPASRWATHAQPGDRLQMVAPCRDHADDPGGYEWQPPAGIRHVVLIGDETALPAVVGILEALAQASPAPNVQAFIEVPLDSDRQPLNLPEGFQVNWLARDALGLQQGEGMLKAAREWATLPQPEAQTSAPLNDIDIDTQLVWELATPQDNRFYAWVAGESATVMSIRRHFISERGLDRRALTLMGYWRHGRVLG
ncbi:MAG: siderophore-interacting protein [Pseudomonas sp.]|uniref:siderophore-interacting protein n=1 Tax=Pseudomonas abieticivorans TaxID=2931382 RepID=UPI0020BE43A6|nr:siderophore-interacting protein [Pseudomonas sp. PIA16]MDE1165521.1 siderophore-interacting protein [Pseudomonas sp.]